MIRNNDRPHDAAWVRAPIEQTNTERKKRKNHRYRRCRPPPERPPSKRGIAIRYEGNHIAPPRPVKPLAYLAPFRKGTRSPLELPALRIDGEWSAPGSDDPTREEDGAVTPLEVRNYRMSSASLQGSRPTRPYIFQHRP